jgi:hypothetical protein
VKVILFLAGIAIGIVAATIYKMPSDYRLRVETAERECDFFVLSDPSSNLAPEQINCTMVHDDILIRFQVDAEATTFVECNQDNGSLRAPQPTNCTLYRQ